jgi:uncharacterized protein (DUF1501 family)
MGAGTDLSGGAPASCDCPPPAGLSRRSLLRRIATAGALGTAMTVLDGFGPAGRFAFAAEPGGYAGDVLVVVSLRGGFDGLNAVVPIGDPGYAPARPTIRIPESTLLPAGGIFGLHPALAPLKPFWDAGTFGVVHAVGQPEPSRSHFRAMEELERAAPGSSLRTGWLDRTVGLREAGTGFRATQLGSTQVPSSLVGPAPELSMWSLESFQLSGAWNAVERKRWSTALKAMHAGAPDAVAAPARATLRATSTAAALTESTYTPAGGAKYPGSSLGSALKDVARLIKADVGLQVACVDDGDWDMHADLGTVEKGWLRDHLTDLATSLAAFVTDLGTTRMRSVTVVTLSEFGRRLEENGSGGVDHGNGNAVLLLGGGVNGGQVHGPWPGLGAEELVDGDLAGVTDYRAVLGEILTKRCGLGSVSDVFPGFSGEPLGVVTTR